MLPITESMFITSNPTKGHASHDILGQSALPNASLPLLLPPGTIRLANGNSSNQGTVEFFWQGQWNTLCDVYGMNQQTADVICTQLGMLPGPAQASWGGTYPISSGITASTTYWGCYGSASSLQSCNAYNIDTWSYSNNCVGDNLRQHAVGEAPGISSAYSLA